MRAGEKIYPPFPVVREAPETREISQCMLYVLRSITMRAYWHVVQANIMPLWDVP